MRSIAVIILIVFLCSEIMAQFQPFHLLPVTTTVAPVVSTTSRTQRDCVFNCVTRTPEYNPICGTDGAFYYNLSVLTCAQGCGLVVQPSHPPPCSPVAAFLNTWPIHPRVI